MRRSPSLMQTLDAVTAYRTAHGRLPSVAALQDELDVRSAGEVRDRLGRLERAGLLPRETDRRRSITTLFPVREPVAGSVRGRPGRGSTTPVLPGPPRR